MSSSHSALNTYFESALREILWSETHLVNVLDTMASLATAPELQDAFIQHQQQTRGHAQQIGSVMKKLGMTEQPMPSVGLQGLFDEGWKVINESEGSSSQRDVALIIAAQKVEHYEIACYGSMVTLAKTLDNNDIAEMLDRILDEEKEADALLTSIAIAGINEQARREPSAI